MDVTFFIISFLNAIKMISIIVMNLLLICKYFSSEIENNFSVFPH